MINSAITKQTGELDPIYLHTRGGVRTDPEDLARATKNLYKLLAVFAETVVVQPTAFTFLADEVVTNVFRNYPEYIIGSTEAERVLKPREINYIVNAKLEEIFGNAEHEEFEDGFMSEFSKELSSLAEKHWRVVHAYISNTINSNDYSAMVLSEALITISEIEERATRGQRLRILRQALLSHSPDVRDGATIGIANMDDPVAISWLQSAIEVEPNGILKQNMQLAIDQLQATRDEILLSENR